MSRSCSGTGSRSRQKSLVLSDGLFLGLDLHGDAEGRVGHSTRDSAPLLDLTSDHEVDPAPFWDPVYREEGDRLRAVAEAFLSC